MFNISDKVIELIDKYISSNALLDKYYKVHVHKVIEKSLELIALSGIKDKINTDIVVNGAMLHDIGIILCYVPKLGCFGSEPYIKHGILGAEILKNEGLEEYAKICITHIGTGLKADEIINQNLPLPHTDMLPETFEEKIVCIADKFYSKNDKYLKTPKPLKLIENELKKHNEGSWERFNLYLEELKISLK